MVTPQARFIECLLQVDLIANETEYLYGGLGENRPVLRMVVCDSSLSTVFSHFIPSDAYVPRAKSYRRCRSCPSPRHMSSHCKQLYALQCITHDTVVRLRVQGPVFSRILVLADRIVGTHTACVTCFSQMGVTAPLQAFKTATKGWGVRATGTIQEGAYICSYAGEVGTRS